MKFLKFVICLFILLDFNIIVLSAQDKIVQSKKFQISFDYFRDYILRERFIVGASHYAPIYGWDRVAFHNKYNNYTLGINFKYYPKKYFYIRYGMQYKRQISIPGNFDININGSTKFSVGNNIAIHKSIDFPISLGFSFFNNSIVRPYVEISMNNSFLFYEKVNCRFDYNLSTGYFKDTILENNKFKFYNIKGKVILGCEFHLIKMLVLGIDVYLQTLPMKQTNKTILDSFTYSNFGLGLNFGYVIK